MSLRTVKLLPLKKGNKQVQVPNDYDYQTGGTLKHCIHGNVKPMEKTPFVINYLMGLSTPPTSAEQVGWCPICSKKQLPKGFFVGE